MKEDGMGGNKDLRRGKFRDWLEWQDEIGRRSYAWATSNSIKLTFLLFDS